MTTKKVTIDGALKELKSVAWPRLLFALDIDRTVETRIAEECGVDENAAMKEVLKHWLDNVEDASWETLAKAVMTQPPFRRTGAYIYNKYVNEDRLTADLICEELNFLDDWFQLSYPFLYDSQRIKDVVINMPVEGRKKKLMEFWLLEFDDEPSWEKVARAIEDCFPEYEEKADKIRDKYLPKVEFRHPNEFKIEKLTKLDSKSAFNETSDVVDWYALGWFLGLDEDDLNDVEREHTRVDNRKQAMLELWLKKYEMATWEVLGKALRNMPQHIGLSQRIMKRCREKEEKTQPVVQVEELMDVETAKEEGNEEETKPVTMIDNLKSYLGGIQSAFTHLTSERIQSALTEMNAELDQLRNLVSQMKMKEDTQMRIEEEDSQITVENVLRTMELIDEYHTEFSSEKPFSLDWDKYGCKLHIPQGSIPPGESGTLGVYAIYSGPFEFPENSSLVSGIYYIALSHELSKPATLEIQHSCTLQNKADAQQLQFVSTTGYGGPPYSFKPIEGGYFLPDNTSRYGFIRRTSFSLYTIVWKLVEKVGDLFKKRKRSHEEEEELTDRGGPGYAALYFLIPIEHPTSWTVKLLLTKYINSDREYFRRQQEREKKPVEEDFNPIVLKGNTLSIAILSEEEAKKGTKELKQWDGLEIVISNHWKLHSAVTEISVTELKTKISPYIKLRIEWTGKLTVEKANFRIYLLGIEKDVKIPVTVPHTTRRISSLPSEPSFDGPDELTDPPLRADWMNTVASEAPTKCDMLAIQLLKDEYEKFKAETKDESPEGRYAALYNAWHRIEDDNFTWQKIIDILKMKSIKEISLSEKLEKLYKN